MKTRCSVLSCFYRDLSEKEQLLWLIICEFYGQAVFESDSDPVKNSKLFQLEHEMQAELKKKREHYFFPLVFHVSHTILFNG